MKRLFLFTLMFALSSGCTGNTADSTTDTASTTAVTETSSMTSGDTASTQASTTTQATATQEKPMTDYNNKVAVLHTTAGEIHIRFFPDVAPNHVKNFLDLSTQGFYNGTKFHRVIPGFMIQGGDPNTISGDPRSWGTGGASSNVRAEFNTVKHKRGIVSMARSQDPNSASSQFFIMVADYPSLNGQYSVFGQVTKGMDVADKIVSAETAGQDRPVNPVSITKVEIRDANPDEQGPAPK